MYISLKTNYCTYMTIIYKHKYVIANINYLENKLQTRLKCN